MALAETSHTVRSMPLIGTEFRRVGLQAAFSRPVPDRFEVRNPTGSLRGRSAGVAVFSSYPVFSFEDSRVSGCVWQSSRILHSIVQVGHLAVHCIVTYLHPCAHVGSSFHCGCVVG